MQEIYKELIKNIGSGTNGSRLWPRNKRNDQKYGIRIDLGEKIYDASNGWFRNAIVQFNKNADNEGIRKAIGKNGTHEQRARFQIPLSGDGSGLHESITEEVVVTDMVDVMEDGT